MLFFMLILFMPKSARIRLKARMKRKGILVTLFSDDGFERTELMQSDLGQGILTGNPTTYIFTPRPARIVKKVGRSKKGYVDVAEDQKKNIDEAMLHRLVSDTGKMYLIGYIGKSLAITPKLLELIKKVNRRAIKEDVKELELLDPRILKQYMSTTISRSAIESLKFEHERIGYLRRPVSDKLRKLVLPIGLIVIILIFAYLFLTGDIDFSTLVPWG